MNKLRSNRKGGSVVIAVAVGMLSLAVVSVLWYVMYPIVYNVSLIIDTSTHVQSAQFSTLLQNVWVWIGAIMLIAVIVWAFAYTVKRDFESQYAFVEVTYR